MHGERTTHSPPQGKTIVALKVGDSVNFVDRLCNTFPYKISKVGRIYAYFGAKDHLRVPKDGDPESAVVQSRYSSWVKVGRLTHA